MKEDTTAIWGEGSSEILKSAVDKLNFVSEIMLDWTSEGAVLFETWSEEARIKIFAGIYRLLGETAAALKGVHDDMENRMAQLRKEEATS